MDGENNAKPYEQMDDLGGFPIIFGNTHLLDFIGIPQKPGGFFLDQVTFGHPGKISALSIPSHLANVVLEWRR